MKEWNIALEPFQMPFSYSTARHPAMVAAWGTGKTLLAIEKGIRLSGFYPGNKGLVIRENFTDLKDSTIADFQDYTGYRVKKQDKSVQIHIKDYPDSDILFHHADELAGVIQNINLGWFYIEQAEEFDTDDVFEKLGGRLRRHLTPRKEIQQQLVELKALDRVVESFRDLSEEERLRAESAIITQLNLPLRQGLIIANTNGHNWIWRKWKNKGGQEYIANRPFILTSRTTGKKYDYGKYADLTEAITAQNAKNLPSDYLEGLEVKKKTSPSHYRRYALNSWEDVDTYDEVLPYRLIVDSVGKEILHFHQPRRVISCDPAELGNDHTVIYAFEGGKIIDQEITAKKEPMDTAGRIFRMAKKYNSQLVVIDADGLGGPIRSRLSELGVDVMGVRSGQNSDNKEDFKNVKAEMWMNARDMFIDGLVSLPDDGQLIEDLAAHTYTLNSKGQIIICKKDDVKKKLGGRSPDQGDALVLGLYGLTKVGVEPLFDYEQEDSDIADSYSVKTVF
jgi:hypothetical protein